MAQWIDSVAAICPCRVWEAEKEDSIRNKAREPALRLPEIPLSHGRLE